MQVNPWRGMLDPMPRLLLRNQVASLGFVEVAMA